LRPDLSDAHISIILDGHFGIAAGSIEFLPLGYDSNAGVYRVVGDDGATYFLKARRGTPAEIGVAVPKVLCDLGITQVVAPLPTWTGELWARAGDWHLILYPFVEGVNGFDQPLTDAQWVELGRALRRIHDAALPDHLLRLIPRETLSPRDRQRVRACDAEMDGRVSTDSASARLIAFWRARRAEIRRVVDRAEALAADVQRHEGQLVLCHADLHGGNVLLGPNGELHIVDWDSPILAPKERDLMFIGGGVGDVWNQPREADLFYQGYGPVAIDMTALAYYRYERVVADMAEFCAFIFTSDGGDEDREQSVTYFEQSFEPGSVVDIARQTDSA
jgi:spectinomycin phosphotransferase